MYHFPCPFKLSFRAALVQAEPHLVIGPVLYHFLRKEGNLTLNSFCGVFTKGNALLKIYNYEITLLQHL